MLINTNDNSNWRSVTLNILINIAFVPIEMIVVMIIDNCRMNLIQIFSLILCHTKHFPSRTKTKSSLDEQFESNISHRFPSTRTNRINEKTRHWRQFVFHWITFSEGLDGFSTKKRFVTNQFDENRRILCQRWTQREWNQRDNAEDKIWDDTRGRQSIVILYYWNHHRERERERQHLRSIFVFDSESTIEMKRSDHPPPSPPLTNGIVPWDWWGLKWQQWEEERDGINWYVPMNQWNEMKWILWKEKSFRNSSWKMLNNKMKLCNVQFPLTKIWWRKELFQWWRTNIWTIWRIFINKWRLRGLNISSSISQLKNHFLLGENCEMLIPLTGTFSRR